jgi:hypothetical protein
LRIPHALVIRGRPPGVQPGSTSLRISLRVGGPASGSCGRIGRTVG